MAWFISGRVHRDDPPMNRRSFPHCRSTFTNRRPQDHSRFCDSSISVPDLVSSRDSCAALGQFEERCAPGSTASCRPRPPPSGCRSATPSSKWVVPDGALGSVELILDFKELAVITDERVEYSLRSQDAAQGRWLAEDPSLSTLRRHFRRS